MIKQLDKMYDLIFKDETLVGLFRNISQINWRRLTIEEKEDIMTKINNRVSELYKIPLLKLKFSPAKDRLYGYANSFYWEIMLNQDALDKEDGYEAIDTYFHELRHSFQHRAVEGKLSSKEHADPEDIAAWKLNFMVGNYFSGDSKYYVFQPVEKDAWTTGMQFARRIHMLNKDDKIEDQDWNAYCERHKAIIMLFISDSEESRKQVSAIESEIQEIYANNDNDEEQEDMASVYVTELLDQKKVEQFTFEEVGACLSPYAFSKLSLKNKVKVIQKYCEYIKVNTKRKINIFENTVGSINIDHNLYGVGDSLVLVNSLTSSIFTDIVDKIVNGENMNYDWLSEDVRKELYLNMYRKNGKNINFIKDTDNLFLFSLQPYAKYEAKYILERFQELKDIELKVFGKNCKVWKSWETFYDQDAIYDKASEIMGRDFDDYYKEQLDNYEKNILANQKK